MKVLAARPELCVACGACEESCAQAFFKAPDWERSAIRVTVEGGRTRTGRQTVPEIAFCDQCGECIAICPSQALYRAKNGIVRLRSQDCVGCLACVGFCPSLVMYTYPDDTVPFKCIACGVCVKECPAEALYLTEVPVPEPVTELTRSIRSQTTGGSHGG